ncbi:MAG: ABC transporter permease [Hydrogenophilaceae bacterium]|nr:ABC transporter permease [Hydrogenophilaceae bacterium]
MGAQAISTPWHRLRQEAAGWTLSLRGRWCLSELAALDAAIPGLAIPRDAVVTLDGGELKALDSAGAMLLVRRLWQAGVAWSQVRFQQIPPRQVELLNLVDERFEQAIYQPRPRVGRLARLGRRAADLLSDAHSRLRFLGHAVASLAHALHKPRNLRPRELFVQLEHVGLRALPIMIMMNLLIGMVIAYLTGIQIQKFGANIFIVDAASLGVCRELAPMLVAVLVAGRSGAAFTAQIGAMKVTDEIAAIITLGLSAFQVLVLPRLLAIVLVMPLLTFVGDIAGIYGAMLVADVQLDIGHLAFLDRMQDVLKLKTVVIGLSKAPFFAAAIGLIACHNGLRVSRDARSVGLATTATVVQSIVAVIMIDAFFAILLSELDL